MSQCLFCEDSLKVFCKDCQESFCYHCGTLKHLLDNSLHSHSIILLCEECEKEVSSAFCQNCEQNLCHNCDTRIHNRAKRTQHKREPITHNICVDEIKIIAHLTLDFVKECCELEDLDQLTEQFNEIITNILETHKGLQKKNILFTSVLNQRQDQGEMESTIKTLKDLRLNNFLLLEQEADDDSFDRFLQILTREESGSQETAQKFESTAVDVYRINHTFKSASSMDNLYIFDSFRNETLARILLKQEKLSTKKCFLNFDFADPNPFIATLYSSSKPEDHKLTPCPVVKQLQLGNSSCKKQKGRSEALASDSFNEGHLDEHNKSMPAQDADLWERMGSSRDIYKKTNQSFDELSLLNASSDHVLPKQKSSHHYSIRHAGHQNKLSICNDQPLKNIELHGSLKLSHLLQQELRKFASRGDLLVTKEDLVQKIKRNLPENLKCHVEDVLKQAEEVKLIHSTIRKFLDIQPLYYIGMLLDRLTVESLTWIVQSIRNDLMTPTEKLILSRIKECYGLKVDANVWKAMINYIFSNQAPRPNKANSFERGCSFPLCAKRILDPVTNSDTFVIYLTYDEWIPEDQGTIPENTQEWREFTEFIDRFFKEDETSIDQKMTLARNPSQELDDLSKKAIWSSSVDNIMNRSTTTTTNKKDKSLKVTEDVKAIPGGRYGCAQFIKICGPESLKKLSIGRLTLFVQEAINKGILRYQRTLLIKNNPNDNSMLSIYTEGDGANSSFSMDPILEKKSRVLKAVKDVLVKVLTENPEGIPLAQIPLHLKKEMDLVVNFQELGFPKLKNYLATLTDLVKIESSGTNHAFVKLIKNPIIPTMNVKKNNWNHSREHLFFAEGQESTKNSYMTQSSQNIMMHSKIAHTTNNAPGYNNSQSGFDSRYSCIEPNRMNYNLTTISDSRDSHRLSRRKTLPAEDHLNKVRNLIEEILSEYHNGVVSEKLYKEVCLKLGFEFDFTEYKCNTFDDFLMEYVDHLIDIEMKKDCVIIYPKNFRFGPKSFIPPMNFNPHMMKQPANPPPNLYEFDTKRNLMNHQLSLNTSPFLLNEPPKYNSMDHDVPPGLTKPCSKPRQPTFNMPFNNNPNNPGFSHLPPNYPPQYRPNLPIRSNNSNMNSQNYYDACDPTFERQMQPTHHGHNTSANMGKMDPHTDYFGAFPYTDDGRQGPGLAHFNFGFPPRPESRGVKTLQEESNADLSENIRFIEEILQDDQSYEKSMTNFTLDKTNESSLMGIQSPNLSFTGLMPLDPMGGFMKQNHSKAQSEDFTNKTGLKFCALAHGRVYSAIPERKNE